MEETYLTIGKHYNHQKDYLNASKAYQKAYFSTTDRRKKILYKDMYIQMKLNFFDEHYQNVEALYKSAHILKKENKLQEAQQYLLEAKKLAKQANHASFIRKINRQLRTLKKELSTPSRISLQKFHVLDRLKTFLAYS